MKVTYTAPNRSHHYPYAKQLHQRGHLHRFVSGFSRLSPRAALPELNGHVNRHDFIQTLSLASSRLRLPDPVTNYLRYQSDKRLDAVSYGPARESDVFMFYRTEGFRTARRLRQEGVPVVSVMEEVNSHVAAADAILREEYQRLGMKEAYPREYDFDLRLEAYDTADYILTPSEFVRRSFIERGVAPEKLLKVNFGFQTFSALQQAPRVADDGTFRMLYVGQLHFRKGLRYALQAFNRLQHPKKEFIIVGPKTTHTGLENERIPSGVRFTGVLKGDELAEAYRNASVFVLPSLEEGLALVQGEALSFGIPLLITTNTGGEDLITHGQEGFIVPPADADALTEALQQLADEPQLRAAMSDRALEATQRLGSWDAAGAKLIGEFQRIAPVAH